MVDKPAGVTSHDVVGMLRRRFGERQVGHAGTLDPDATGVLLVGVGRSTRLLRFLTDLGKTYTGEVVFGASTDTLDAAGKVTATFDMSGLTLPQVQAAVSEHLTGHIMQVPPMVSAVKIDGRRLHELARQGIEVERPARPVTIGRFDVSATADPMVYAIEVQCSKGTYIRTLADDLGRLCGGGAHLRNLRRTAVGSFTVAEAAQPDAVQLLTLPQAMRDYPQVAVDAELAGLVGNGRVLDRAQAGFQGDGPWAVLGPDGELLAMYEAHGDSAKPAVVIA
ncbi:MAG: tRNA pseudouridine(55) synthase TruB [Ilumatobacteraceae bacterium]|nr:tRNA pseudouridine(55) synthase TruB [Ilumatobacteraceae bacterium]MBP7888929.1 tRNA pseudouridine(55) synthase TruB [Ilumatobacteraceae bacterium]MBP8208964.1 tRNA pseudouridine(55) synthase TruB [Ilumatobacteraceae bacterium]